MGEAKEGALMPAIQVGHLSTERGPCNNCGREEVRVLSGPSEPYGPGYWCDPCLQAYHLGQRTQQDWLMLVCPELKGALDHWYEGVIGRSVVGIWREEEHEFPETKKGPPPPNER